MGVCVCMCACTCTCELYMNYKATETGECGGVWEECATKKGSQSGPHQVNISKKL